MSASDLGSPRQAEDQLGTIALQIQQFLDEWMFRILQGGMAGKWDRSEATTKAMEIFEAMGMTPTTPEEKAHIVSLEDDEEMCMAIAKLMPDALAKNLESFFLQLQLAVSIVSRVRGAIEDGTGQDLKETMEDGDAGITQTVLKNAVIVACADVKEVQDSEDGWKKAMKIREARLQRAADEAGNAQKELDNIKKELAVFGGQQNAKTANIILSMNSGNTKVIMQVAWTAWSAYYTKYKSEKHIHDKWRGQIQDAESQLLKLKMEKKDGMKSIMRKQFAGNAERMLKEVFNEWVKGTADEKEQKAMAAQVQAAEARLQAMKSTQKANAKKAMAKVAGQSDGALTDMIFKEWLKFTADGKRDKELNDQVKATEARLKAFQAKSKEGQKGVLAKMSASTDTGLLSTVFTSWLEEVHHEKKAKHAQQQIDGANSKFAMLKSRNKNSSTGRVESANELEQSILVMHIFMNWSTSARIAALINHYGGKMDRKKEQLEKVQVMFKSFASQLEAGIGNTPRSQRKSMRTATDAQKPPAVPPA
ncbi:unnamed protein product [Prorocentrum cordatum]|uniref:Uncharacterized protein n=1 Tax=Prorocentrum cordatum TaxID=2364126 RepID=A0ABN9SYB4_9DINO|nr:unnamed protein product [Polarella glacialis]